MRPIILILAAVAVTSLLAATASAHAPVVLGPPYVLPKYGYVGPHPRPVYDPYYLPYYRFRLYLSGHPRPNTASLYLPAPVPAGPPAVAPAAFPNPIGF